MDADPDSDRRLPYDRQIAKTHLDSALREARELANNPKTYADAAKTSDLACDVVWSIEQAIERLGW